MGDDGLISRSGTTGRYCWIRVIPQPGEAVVIDRTLPSEKFLDRQQIAAAGLFERQEPAANGCYHLGLATNHPARRPWRREVGNCQRAAVGPADVLPWAMSGHVVIARKEPMPKSYTLEFKLLHVNTYKATHLG